MKLFFGSLWIILSQCSGKLTAKFQLSGRCGEILLHFAIKVEVNEKSFNFLAWWWLLLIQVLQVLKLFWIKLNLRLTFSEKVGIKLSGSSLTSKNYLSKVSLTPTHTGPHSKLKPNFLVGKPAGMNTTTLDKQCKIKKQKFQTELCVNIIFRTLHGNKFEWLSSSGSLLCFFNQNSLCYSNCWPLHSWHLCWLFFSQFTWKCTKKKTKYALFQIETEFDCLLKTEYSITALGLARPSELSEVVVYSPVTPARSII